MLRIWSRNSAFKVTAEDPIHYASRGKAAKVADTMIHVQPLKRSEMQVCVLFPRSFQLFVILCDFCKPSYAQDFGTSDVVHGVYGSLMQCLGSVIGFCGAIPCFPCPNPFKEVEQGIYYLLILWSQNNISKVLSVSFLVLVNFTSRSILVSFKSTSAQNQSEL